MSAQLQGKGSEEGYDNECKAMDRSLRVDGDKTLADVDKERSDMIVGSTTVAVDGTANGDDGQGWKGGELILLSLRL